MIIVGLSDIHDDVSRLAAIAEDLCKADVVVISGDITHFGDRAAAAAVINELRIYNNNVLAVAGNCDSAEVSRYLDGQQINLDQRCMVVGIAVFAGIGGSLPCPGKTLNEISEAEFRRHLQEATKNIAAALPLVLVTHQPPYGTSADLAGGSHHVGSRAICEFIAKYKPALCLCGHIHEARSVSQMGSTVIVNPGPLRRGGYAYIELDGMSVKAEVRGV